MKKSLFTLRLLTGLGLSATLFLGCQEFLGGNDNATPIAKTAEDGATPRETAEPGDVHTSPPSSAPSDSACQEVSARYMTAKYAGDVALAQTIGAEWSAMGCVSPPGPYISPEQKCLDAKEQLGHTLAEGYGPGHKYYETWLTEVNKYCPATP